jgi:hypothetical protein
MLHFLESDPNERRALIRQIIAAFNARHGFMPHPDDPVLLPIPAPEPDIDPASLPALGRAGGRMSADQLARARRGWGGAYAKHVLAEHGDTTL